MQSQPRVQKNRRNGKTVTICAMIYTDGDHRVFGVFGGAIKHRRHVDIHQGEILARYAQTGGPFPTSDQYYEWAKAHQTPDSPAFRW